MTDAGTRRLVVVRHGETLDNAGGVWQGHRDSELSPIGLAQAEKAAPVLAAYDPQLIVTSDLVRALVTAEQVGRAAGVAVEVDPRLREVHVGEWQGSTSADVRRRDPDLLAAMGRGEDVRRGRTGETVAELAVRVRAALDDVVAVLEPGRVAVVVCHGVAARAGVASLVGLDQMQAQRVLWGLENCHWAVLAEASLVSGAPVPARWRIDAWNVGA
jgi:glucosyl-3-phosphoglycerate phosphatase